MERSFTIGRCASAAALAIALLAALGASAQSARAHSAFLEATPAPGSRLETSPSRIVLEFTEPLNRSLTKAQIVDARTGRKVATRPLGGDGRQLVVRPARALPSPVAYRVDWHTVSTLDGHALEGSFGLGVRTAAVGGAQRLEQSPLARDGWLRIASRAVFYAALLFFAGGLLAGLLTRASRSPWAWVVPSESGSSRFAGVEVEEAQRAIWRRTRAAAWVAAAAGGLVAVVETIDAAGTLSARAVDAYRSRRRPVPPASPLSWRSWWRSPRCAGDGASRRWPRPRRCWRSPSAATPAERRPGCWPSARTGCTSLVGRCGPAASRTSSPRGRRGCDT